LKRCIWCRVKSWLRLKLIAWKAAWIDSSSAGSRNSDADVS